MFQRRIPLLAVLCSAVLAASLALVAPPTQAETPAALAAQTLAGDPTPDTAESSRVFPDALGFGREIDSLANRGIVKGWDDGTFRPVEPVERQAAIAMIWRALDEPATTLTDTGFSDVPPGHPFHEPIAWAVENGVTKGWPDGTFRGGLPVARDAFAAFLWRASGKVAPTHGLPLVLRDVPTRYHLAPAIDWATKDGIMSGWPNSTFKPASSIERQAAAAALARWQWFVPRPVNHKFSPDCPNWTGGKRTRVSKPLYDRAIHYDAKPNDVHDYRGATWNGRTNSGSGSGYVRWPLAFRGTGPYCLVGGTYRGAWPHTDTDIWSTWYHNSTLVVVQSEDVLVEGVAGRHIGDGLSVSRGTVHPSRQNEGARGLFRANYLQYIGDDCVENDNLLPITVTDNLFEHCFMGLSAQPHTDAERDPTTDNVFRYENNLMSFGHFAYPYKWWETWRGCGNGGHAMMFKVGGVSQTMAWALNDNIFLLEDDACGSGSEMGIWDTMNIVECSNNTIVWLGEGPVPVPKPGRPGPKTHLPDCFKVTTDRSVWDNAVNHWKATHPNIAP